VIVIFLTNTKTTPSDTRGGVHMTGRAGRRSFGHRPSGAGAKRWLWLAAEQL